MADVFDVGKSMLKDCVKRSRMKEEARESCWEAERCDAGGHREEAAAYCLLQPSTSRSSSVKRQQHSEKFRR